MFSTIPRAFARCRAALFCVAPLWLLGCEFVESAELERPTPVEPKRYNVVPLPRVVVEREGSLEIGLDATISTTGTDADLDRVASLFAERLRSVTGFAVPVVVADATANPSVVELVLDPSMIDDEGYVLDATTARVRISAKSARGIFYGIATLRQLLPPEVDRSGPSDAAVWMLPAVRIEDAPRFPYRGMHLDVSRHFFSVDFVKRYIDLMALYKLNTFHWHLTDDQGWRIDVHKYPRLVEVGAVRKETVVGRPGADAKYDGQPYGGFYTHEQIRDVVAYAADRFVTIVPEIEMPGHSLAALASYPELACTPGPFETATTWGVFDDVLCPSEGTFQFLTDVLTEVIELFPGSYVHVGGDEVPTRRWEESAVAQEVVVREGLSSASDLGPYFVRRVGAFLESRGRKLVGWDEIAERGDIPGATVMSWRGVDKGVDAVRRGHPVVMTPIEYCYFDHPQGGDENEPLGAGGPLTLDQVYRFDPAPAPLTAPQVALVMGGQANLWTEYIATQPFADYMVFPRMLALSEAVWSPQAARSYPDFLARLTGNAKHLDALSVNYAHQFQAP